MSRLKAQILAELAAIESDGIVKVPLKNLIQDRWLPTLLDKLEELEDRLEAIEKAK